MRKQRLKAVSEAYQALIKAEQAIDETWHICQEACETQYEAEQVFKKACKAERDAWQSWCDARREGEHG